MRRESLIALTLMLSALVVSADVHVPPPSLPVLAKVWIGGEPGGSLSYFRLELQPDGRGLLTVQYLPSQPAVAYKVSGTRLVGYEIEFQLEPTEPPTEPIYLRGRAIAHRLTLEVGGAGTLKWKRPVVLEPDAAVLARLKAVTERAERYHRENR